jgi:hypothetical protein
MMSGKRALRSKQATQAIPKLKAEAPLDVTII